MVIFKMNHDWLTPTCIRCNSEWVDRGDTDQLLHVEAVPLRWWWMYLRVQGSCWWQCCSAGPTAGDHQTVPHTGQCSHPSGNTWKYRHSSTKHAKGRNTHLNVFQEGTVASGSNLTWGQRDVPLTFAPPQPSHARSSFLSGRQSPSYRSRQPHWECVGCLRIWNTEHKCPGHGHADTTSACIFSLVVWLWSSAVKVYIWFQWFSEIRDWCITYQD